MRSPGVVHLSPEAGELASYICPKIRKKVRSNRRGMSLEGVVNPAFEEDDECPSVEMSCRGDSAISAGAATAAATAVALERGVQVVEFAELEFRDYLDHVHLTPHGHEVVAARLAQLLAR